MTVSDSTGVLMTAAAPRTDIGLAGPRRLTRKLSSRAEMFTWRSPTAKTLM
jgi:hypothetical protein